jgi:CDP-L-myo-inositol myo-inositolphosphotransferase
VTEQLRAIPVDPSAGRNEGKGVSGLDGPVSKHLNRPLSRRISGRVWRWPVSPNQWSWASFGLANVGAVAFAARAPRLGGVLVHGASVLDGVDGEVARLQGKSSSSGALLDLVLDRVSDVSIVGGLAWGAGGRRIDWLLALTAANGLLVSGIAKERVGAERQPVAELQRSEATGSWLDAVVAWTGRDGRLFAVTLGGLLKQPRLTLAWLALSSNLRLVRRFSAARAMLDAQSRSGTDSGVDEVPREEVARQIG